MRGIEILLFGTLAGGVHLGAFALWAPQITGGGTGGAQGAAAISLQAAPAQLAAMVEAWQTPPVSDVALTAAPRAPQVPAPPRVSVQPAAMPTPAAPPMRPQAAELPSDAPQILQPGPSVVPHLPQATSGTLPQRLATPARPTAPSAFQRVARTAPARPDMTSMREIDTQSADAARAAPQASARPTLRPPNRAATADTAPVPQTRAAGSGNTARAAVAQSTQAQSSTANPGAANRKLEAAWGASIQAKVQRNARNPGVGPATVRVQLQVAPSGKLIGLGVTRSSGSAAADHAALSAVKRARRFAAAPEALDKARYVFQVTLRFE